MKGLTTNDNVDSRIPSTYYDHDNDDDDVEQPALQSKQRMSSVKKVKRQNVSSTPLMASAKRKGDIQGGDSSLEVDIKRIKADPDAGSGGGADDNGDLFEGGADGEDYEGLGQFDDDGADFDDSVAGGSGAGTSGGDNKGRRKETRTNSGVGTEYDVGHPNELRLQSCIAELMLML